MYSKYCDNCGVLWMAYWCKKSLNDCCLPIAPVEWFERVGCRVEVLILLYPDLMALYGLLFNLVHDL